MSNKTMENQKKIKSIKSAKAIKREIHFSNGGTPQLWRGLASAHTSSAEKRQDRKKVKTKFIKDSSEE